MYNDDDDFKVGRTCVVGGLKAIIVGVPANSKAIEKILAQPAVMIKDCSR